MNNMLPAIMMEMLKLALIRQRLHKRWNTVGLNDFRITGTGGVSTLRAHIQMNVHSDKICQAPYACKLVHIYRADSTEYR